MRVRSILGAATVLLATATTARAQTWIPSDQPTYSHYGAFALPGNRVLALFPSGEATTMVFDGNTRTWHVGGKMAVIHDDKSGVQLKNGDVLVAGGKSGSTDISTVEIFNQTTEKWRTVAPLKVPTHGAALVTVASGQVVIFQPIDTSTVTSTVEAYDPGTNAWTIKAKPPVLLISPHAVALKDGRVLVVEHPKYFFYEPVFDTYTAAAAPDAEPTALSDTVFLTLNDGRVMRFKAGDRADDDIFDPAANTWTKIPRKTPTTPRGAPVLLGTGRVLVAGGLGYTSKDTREAQLFDPTSNVWIDAPLMEIARGNAVSAAIDGGAIVISGTTNDPASEIYLPAGPGGACKLDGDCAAGACSDGVCCDRPCTGVCERCDTSTAKGVCTPVDGPVNHCEPGMICNSGACETNTGAVCDGEELKEKRLDLSTHDCAPFRCNGATGVCFKGLCSKTDECAPKHACDPDTRACVPVTATAANGCSTSTSSSGGEESTSILTVVVALVCARLRRRAA